MAANEPIDRLNADRADDVLTRRRITGGAANDSAAGLVRRLMSDVAVLFRKELALASSEIMHAVDDAKSGAGAMVSGGAVLYAGLLFLLGAATLGLANVVAGWLAALIVGGITALVGYLMLHGGKKKLEARSFAPQRAMDSLRKDADSVRRQVQ
jgi:putative superfamily III holin-X